MSNTEPEEPRFGRRSENWTPDDSDSSSSSHESRSDSVRTPWPQYGQLSAEAASSTSAAGSSAGSRSALSEVGASGATLPSRKPATLILVLGVLLMLVVAPLAFLTAMVAGSGVEEKAASVRTISNGDTVTVDEAGSYFIVPSTFNVYSCTLTDEAGTVHAMDMAPGVNAFTALGLTPGPYVVQCQGEGEYTLEGMNFYSEGDLMSMGLRAFAWGSAVGGIGLIILIWGIVALVRVIGRRRAMLHRIRP